MSPSLEQETLPRWLAESVSGAQPDLDALTRGAVRQGRSLRRRRRAGVAGAAASVLAVLGVLGSVQLGGGAEVGVAGPSGGSRPGASPEETTSDPSTGGRSSTITGRSTVAALLDQLQDQLDREVAATGFTGQDSSGGATSTFGSLVFAADATAPKTALEVNVQSGNRDLFTSDNWFSCQEGMLDCSRTRGEDGVTRVLSYERHVTEGAEARVSRVVDVIRPNGFRVVVVASNASEVKEGHGQVVRDLPPLDLEQVGRIATWKGWAPQLNEVFETAGAELYPYTVVPAG